MSCGASGTWSATGPIRTSAPAWWPSTAHSAWWATTTWPSWTSSTTHPSPPRRRQPYVGPEKRQGPRRFEFLRGLKPADEGREVALYHASPRDPVWEYVLWPDQAAECIAVQAARVSLVGHSHVALFFVMAGDGDREAARAGGRAPGHRPGRPGPRRHPARPFRRSLADQPRQRRPAPRRGSARRLAGARHGCLGGHLPPGRVRDRPRRRRDRDQGAAGAPGKTALRWAVNANAGY